MIVHIFQDCRPLLDFFQTLSFLTVFEKAVEKRERGTALGLLAVPTKLGNPGGWEYRRVFLYSHDLKIVCQKLASKYFWWKVFWWTHFWFFSEWPVVCFLILCRSARFFGLTFHIMVHKARTFCTIDILSAGPNHWIFMWVAMLDNFLTDFAPAEEPTHVGVLPHG